MDSLDLHCFLSAVPCGVCGWCIVLPSLDSRILSRLRRAVRRFNAELLGVLGVQSLPAAELHGLGAGDAANGSPAEKVIQNVETNVPPGSTHGDKAATDV